MKKHSQIMPVLPGLPGQNETQLSYTATIFLWQGIKGLLGVGKAVALNISLETTPIGRFKKVENYASYCR